MERIFDIWRKYRMFFVLGSLILIIMSGSIYFYFRQTTPETEWETFATTSRSMEQIQSTDKKEILIDIKGEVKKPGVYTLSENARLQEAIFLAGGLTEKAEEKSLNLAAKLTDQQMIYVPNKEEAAETLPIQNLTNENAAKTDDTININTATVTELQELSGIGEKKAQAIIDYREENGPFASVEDLTEVSGIGEKTVEKLKPSITI